ncbi:hypothetical protein SKAU_G00099960 [Synaphobranchus kaupii]|uniref:Uncharacterized protein n=1 Tax=Synaphobranchus kaupii TaxID=118154 RepID=A0A9Q1FY66_SYNKA|nr:hypothetical protein SKAU_G00099960 [Synaphobranchus kaupii]
MRPGAVDFSGLTPYYNSVLQAWYQTLRLSRGTTCSEGWVLQEPLLHNPMFPMGLLQSINIQTCLQTAGVTKLGDLVCGGGWRSASELAREVGMRSTRLMQQLLEGIRAAFPASHSGALQIIFHLGKPGETGEEFPPVSVAAAYDDQRDLGNSLLNPETPQRQTPGSAENSTPVPEPEASGENSELGEVRQTAQRAGPSQESVIEPQTQQAESVKEAAVLGTATASGETSVKGGTEDSSAETLESVELGQNEQSSGEGAVEALAIDSQGNSEIEDMDQDYESDTQSVSDVLSQGFHYGPSPALFFSLIRNNQRWLVQVHSGR